MSRGTVITSTTSGAIPISVDTATGGLSFPEPKAGLAPCDPLVAFGRYVLAATSTGQVCVYVVRDFDGATNEDLVAIDDAEFIGEFSAPPAVLLWPYPFL